VEPQISFPVIGFWLSEETHGHRHNERFRLFSSSPDLHHARLRELRRSERANMLLVDNACRVWAVSKVWSVGPRTQILMRALLTVFRQSDDIEHAVDYELEDRGLSPFTEVQDRVCQSIDRNPGDWVDDEAMAGEAGPPVKLADILEAVKAAVKQATNLKELSDGLDAAWPD
jgi:hypothetical protein